MVLIFSFWKLAFNSEDVVYLSTLEVFINKCQRLAMAAINKRRKLNYPETHMLFSSGLSHQISSLREVFKWIVKIASRNDENVRRLCCLYTSIIRVLSAEIHRPSKQKDWFLTFKYHITMNLAYCRFLTLIWGQTTSIWSPFPPTTYLFSGTSPFEKYFLNQSIHSILHYNFTK